MQICMKRIGENAILMHFNAIVPVICSSGELDNILTTNLQMIFQQCGTAWEAKFIVSNVRVIDTVGFLSVFFKFCSNNY